MAVSRPRRCPTRPPPAPRAFSSIMRRPNFADPRVREALDLAFDFEWSNKNLFYGLYKRTASFFENSDLKAEGSPTPAELALLEPLRGQIPDEAFGRRRVAAGQRRLGPGPQTADEGEPRSSTRPAGSSTAPCAATTRAQPLKVEFLLDDPSFERIVGPYVQNLRRIGVDASIRIVDDAQYQQRLKDFDFDTLSPAFRPRPDARHRASRLLWLGCRIGPWQLQPCRREVAGRRRADRQGHRRPSRARSSRSPAVRSTGFCGPCVLGAALAQGQPQHCPLGRVRQAGDQAQI